MRITRLKLNTDVSAYLKQYTKRFGFDDHGFVEDMFTLLRLKGAGLPSKARIEKVSAYIAKKEKMAKESIVLLITKRKMIFRSF